MLVRRELVWCASTRHAVGTHAFVILETKNGADARKIKHMRCLFALARILLKEGKPDCKPSVHLFHYQGIQS
jgi:hypothetical protein